MGLVEETPVPLKLIGYTSGAWPCGIADYHAKVVAALTASHVECHTVPLPTDSVYRDRPLALWRRRKLYGRLAARSGDYDAALLDLLTLWNGFRPGENTLPAFMNHLRGPLFMTLHEWPTVIAPEAKSKSLPGQMVQQLANVATRLGELRGLSYEEWIRRRMFSRAGHILVHARSLEERLLSVGVPPERVTFRVLPVPTLPTPVRSASLDEFAVQFANRRKIIIFGFPHPRKALERAIEVLPQLPADVVLMFVGGIEGEFRQQYVRSLRELAGGLGVLDRVTFLGEIPEASLAAAFAMSEFALAPFDYAAGSSSFSYLISEGVPIVASDLAEHTALAQDGAGIVTFKSGDIDALTNTIRSLLNNQDRRRLLADRSRAFARRHTYSNLAGTIRERLEEMVRSSSSSA